MKRLILSISLVIGLIAAAAAQADVFHGSNADGGALSFLAKERNGQIQTVRPFLTGFVVLHCPGGDISRSYNTDEAMRVSKKGHFSGVLTPLSDEASLGTTTIRVQGAFTQRNQKAVGTLDVHLTGVSFGDCDSGVVAWTTKGGSQGSGPSHRGAL
jgi:hypothetical protein